MTNDETLEGVFLGKGVECPQLKLTSGEQISLSGAVAKDVALGEAVRVTGRFVNMSKCMQGRTFVVSSFATTGTSADN